jgi:hypothetical protein
MVQRIKRNQKMFRYPIGNKMLQKFINRGTKTERVSLKLFAAKFQDLYFDLKNPPSKHFARGSSEIPARIEKPVSTVYPMR